MADQHTSSLIPASNPFPKRHKGLAVEEVKGPVVAGHLGLADGHVNPLGLEVRVRPGGKKISVQSWVVAAALPNTPETPK